MNALAFEQIKLAIAIAAMMVMLVLAGCGAGAEPSPYPSIWTQKVALSGWGFTMATAYGPFNLGYLSWQRNLDQPLPVAQPPAMLPSAFMPRATIP
jgi:hypothetical protein